jgi:hypothetical protein
MAGPAFWQTFREEGSQGAREWVREGGHERIPWALRVFVVGGEGHKNVNMHIRTLVPQEKRKILPRMP